MEYADEHVPKYSRASLQVPYNQQLETSSGISYELRDGYDSPGMAEQNKKNEVEQIVERAVAQVLSAQLPQLQSQIARLVLDSLPAPATETGGPSHGSSSLVQAVSNIYAGSTQKEILRALLDNGSEYCSRIALFVIKAGAATGWQARGFRDDETVKDVPLEMAAGPVANAYENRVATPGNIAEMGKAFVDQFDGPADEQVLVLPLTLKEKVAALVYADGGDNSKLDSAALELLVLATSAWLEVSSLRKQAVKEEPPAARLESTPAPVQTISSFSDPFAAHSPKHVPVSIPETPAVEAPTEVVEVGAAHSSAAAAAAATDPLAGLSQEDAEIHRKAQRFARLLVDEIKLYNQAKVAEGRRNKDLYDRLKEDIDKSRGTFQKRYGSTAAATGDYFQHELLRSLAEDDISIMGANFRH